MILAMIGSATDATAEGTPADRDQPYILQGEWSNFAMGSVLGYGENKPDTNGIWPAVEPSNQTSNGVAA